MASTEAALLPLQVVTDAEIIPIPMLRDLFSYWQDKKGDREMPTRADISPTDIINQLSKIVLMDVESEPVRFKFRLVGTDIVKTMGRDVTGEYLDSLSPGSEVNERFKWLAENKTSYYLKTQLDWLGRNFQKYHVLCLPLGDDNGNVNMVMCGVDPFYAAAA